MTRSLMTRYQQVSRRAMLKASVGAGAVILVPGLACGNNDAEVFAGAAAEPATEPAASLPSTSVPEATATPGAATTGDDVADEPTPGPTAEEAALSSGLAVAGEMVISFTYSQAAGGKNESPYVAVWIEDAAGDLAQTVALWYQQGRRGDRWLDHLSRWFDVDAERVQAGGADDAATISSATRTPGSYTVVWDGTVAGQPAVASDYFVCIEAVREDGPYSLIREPFSLAGSLAESSLPDEGELSSASVRIDA